MSTLCLCLALEGGAVGERVPFLSRAGAGCKGGVRMCAIYGVQHQRGREVNMAKFKICLGGPVGIDCKKVGVNRRAKFWILDAWCRGRKARINERVHGISTPALYAKRLSTFSAKNCEASVCARVGVDFVRAGAKPHVASSRKSAVRRL